MDLDLLKFFIWETRVNNKYERSLTDKTVIPVALVVKNNYKIREKSDTPVCEIVALEKVDNWV